MKIVDNCVDRFLADEIENIFFDNYTYWWYDSSTLGKYSSQVETEFSETFQFVHPIMDNGRHDSPYTDIILRLANLIFQNQKVEVLNYRRIKINQLLKSQNVEYKPHPPHIDDVAENMYSVVYYINDCDGPTYFFDNELNCIQQVEPKKNRCVMFPSNLYHASSSPTYHKRRMVVNIVASTLYKSHLR